MDKITLEMTREDAARLWLLVADSSAFNGLGQVYYDLGVLVTDKNGKLPSHEDYDR